MHTVWILYIILWKLISFSFKLWLFFNFICTLEIFSVKHWLTFLEKRLHIYEWALASLVIRSSSAFILILQYVYVIKSFYRTRAIYTAIYMCAWAARALMHVTYPPVHLRYEITARYTGSSSMIEEWGSFFSLSDISIMLKTVIHMIGYTEESLGFIK